MLLDSHRDSDLELQRAQATTLGLDRRSCCSASSLHEMLELAGLLHIHALLVPSPVVCLIQQALALHEINLQCNRDL